MTLITDGAMGIRKAARWSEIAYSTLQASLPKKSSAIRSAPALCEIEELMMVSLLTKLTEQGTPLTNEHVADTVSIVVNFMLPPC